MPIPRRLLPYLEHEPRRSGLVFGTDGTKPFVLTTGRKRALTAWGWHFRTLEPLPDVDEYAAMDTLDAYLDAREQAG